VTSHAKVECSGTSRFSLDLIFRPQKREVEGKTIAGTDRGEFTSKKKAKPAVVESFSEGMAAGCRSNLLSPA